VPSWQSEGDAPLLLVDHPRPDTASGPALSNRATVPRPPSRPPPRPTHQREPRRRHQRLVQPHLGQGRHGVAHAVGEDVLQGGRWRWLWWVV
jgi:hypothetical protein